VLTTHPVAIFSQADIHAAAERILESQPDPVPKYRLMNEVLRMGEQDLELTQTKQKLAQSKWIHQLQDAQLPDGSWGRFHSQDTKVKSIFRTSETAIDRAFSLGLDHTHPVLIHAKIYIVDVLSGRARISDREEKNEAWPLLIRYILAGRLAQIEPSNPILEEGWNYLSEITKRTFASGGYRQADEAAAFLQVTNTRVPNGFIESQHALWILSARQLPGQLERQLVDWLRKKPDGIRYIRTPFSNPTPKTIGAWLRSMNILTRFAAWKPACIDMLNQLWRLRGADGLWNSGPQTARFTDFPISEDWRHVINRKVDYSTSLLALFRKLFD
jgi:hypothetical protein